MFSVLFPVFSSADALMSVVLPAVVRICIWGLLGGVLAIGVYALVSNQKAIAALKSEARVLRKKMLDPALDQDVFVSSMKQNLFVSLSLLARVFLPTMVASVPVLLTAIWLAIHYTYALPEGGEIQVTSLPEHDALFIEAGESKTGAGSNRISINTAEYTGSVSVRLDDNKIYSGNPFHPPTAIITKKNGWHTLISSESGYLSDDAPIHELHFSVERRAFIKGVPDWVAGWEFTFFVSVFISALAIKLLFRVE